jgi:16S rRNA (uracil1498-N3)-methyltransferase
VRRLRAGETLTCADGSGAWRRYKVRDAAVGRLDLAADGPVRQEPTLTPVNLGLALTKHALDQVVARCTELGVDEIIPVHAKRSVARWDDERAAKVVERLRVIAREAAAQSRRARIPRIAAVTAVGRFADRDGLLIADRSGIGAPALEPPGRAGWTVLIGPEGGFDPDELTPFATSVPRLAVGPHVLRAETAPVAVVAALRSVAPSGPGGLPRRRLV